MTKSLLSLYHNLCKTNRYVHKHRILTKSHYCIFLVLFSEGGKIWVERRGEWQVGSHRSYWRFHIGGRHAEPEHGVFVWSVGVKEAGTVVRVQRFKVFR